MKCSCTVRAVCVANGARRYLRAPEWRNLFTSYTVAFSATWTSMASSSTPGFFKGKMHVFDRRGCVAPDGTIGSTEVKMDTNTPTNTLSRCIICDRLWDQYKGKRRCVTCGTLVLVCEHCQSAGRDRQQGSSLRCELCLVSELPSEDKGEDGNASTREDEAASSTAKRARQDASGAFCADN